VIPAFYPILPHSALPKDGAQAVGNKGWNLMLMANAGLPVPPAFVLPTGWCCQITKDTENKQLREVLASEISALENATGLGFGSPRRPLLVSVRSGAVQPCRG
jgi:pyruvate,orthophosphate dikinase